MRAVLSPFLPVFVAAVGSFAMATACAEDDEENVATTAPGGSGGVGGLTGSGGTTGGEGGETVGDPRGRAGARQSFVYIQSNDPNGNAILAFERSLEDGSLTPVPNGSFRTNGTGVGAGLEQRVGPLDSDRNVVLSDDKKLLFAVNSGSDSVAVFRTSRNGALSAVPGSPFASGGRNPVSLGLANGFLYVVNKAVDGVTAPNYAAFAVDSEGALSPIPNGIVTSPTGGSPAIAYVPPGRRVLFGTQFMDSARSALAPTRQIDSFVIGADALLSPAPGSPYALPSSGGVALGVVSHPLLNVLYVALPTQNQLAVYDYDEAGALSVVNGFSNSGKGISRLLVNENATRLYSANPQSGTISTYDITTSRSPSEIYSITLQLANAGPAFIDAFGATQTVTSQPFQIAFDDDQDYLYVVSQRATSNVNDEAGNYLHTLRVDSDGGLSEPGAPIDLRAVGVPALARAQGIAVY